MFFIWDTFLCVLAPLLIYTLFFYNGDFSSSLETLFMFHMETCLRRPFKSGYCFVYNRSPFSLHWRPTSSGDKWKAKKKIPSSLIHCLTCFLFVANYIYIGKLEFTLLYSVHSSQTRIHRFHTSSTWHYKLETGEKKNGLQWSPILV